MPNYPSDEPESFDSTRLVRLLRAADKVLPELSQALDNSRLFPPPLSHRGRVKRELTVIEKIERKRRLKPRYGLEDVQDIIGLRFVTLLRMDIAPVVDNIFKLLTAADAAFERGPFARARLVDFRQYLSNPPPAIDPETGAWLDPLRDRLRDSFHHYYPTPHIEFIEELRAKYSSVHMVIEVPSDHDGHLTLPVEIQVRSVFEEAWSEIDHKMFYEADRQGLITGRQERLAASRHLGILKGMLDTAADYAGIISEVNFTGADEHASNIKANLDGVDYIKETVAPLKAHRELLDMFVALATEKDRLDGQVRKGEASRSAYAALADQFSDLLLQLNGATKDEGIKGAQGERMRSVLYQVAMEEALSRLLSGNPVQIRRAIAAYQVIAGDYPTLPTCLFRLAQAYIELVEHIEDHAEATRLAEEAFEAYGRARSLLNAIQKNKHLMVSPGQWQYLNGNIERLQGFAVWRPSDRKRDRTKQVGPEDLDAAVRAWSATKRRAAEPTGLSEDETFNLLNSATYFGLDAIGVHESLGLAHAGLPTREELEPMIRRLAKLCAERKPESINCWHTLLRGHAYLGDEVQKRAAAKQVLRAHTREDLKQARLYDQEIHLRAFREAWRVLDKPEDGLNEPENEPDV